MMKLPLKKVFFIVLIVLLALLIGYFIFGTSQPDNGENTDNTSKIITNTASNMNTLDMYAVEETVESATNSEEFYTEYAPIDNKFYRETDDTAIYYKNGTTAYADGSTPTTKNRTSTVPFDLITTDSTKTVTENTVRIEGSDMQKYPRTYIEQIVQSSDHVTSDNLSVTNFMYEVVIDSESERVQYMEMQVQTEEQNLTVTVSFEDYSLSNITSLNTDVSNSEDEPVLENIDHPTAPDIGTMKFNNQNNLIINITNIPEDMTDLWVTTSNVRKSIPLQTDQTVVLERGVDFDPSEPMVEVRAEFQNSYSISVARYR